jgi:hypothetical protein
MYGLWINHGRVAHWSSGWQTDKRRPQKVMWSGMSGAPTAPNEMVSKARSWSAPSAGIMMPCFLRIVRPG